MQGLTSCCNCNDIDDMSIEWEGEGQWVDLWGEKQEAAVKAVILNMSKYFFFLRSRNVKTTSFLILHPRYYTTNSTTANAAPPLPSEAL